MSHVMQVAGIKCANLGVLGRVATRLGGELVIGQQTHAWWGTWNDDWADARAAANQGRDPKTFGKCDHAIRIAGRPGVNGADGPWEVGVIADSDGTLALVYDNFGPAGQQLEAFFGQDLTRLVDEIAIEETMNAFLEDGLRPVRIDSEDGVEISVEY